MPTQERMAEASARSLVRAAIRDYCRVFLFAAPVRGVTPEQLLLPRRSRLAAFTEADVYTSRPGAGDYGVNSLNIRESTAAPAFRYDIGIGYAGLTEPESLANAAMGSIGPMALQLRRKAPSYRAFLARETRAAQQAPLRLSQERVLDGFAALESHHQATLRLLDQSHPGRVSVRQAARQANVEESTMKKRITAACDALADVLYALYDARAAA